MDEPKKFCPMNASTDEVLTCCREKCAWWNELSQACALLAVSRALTRISVKSK